MCSLWLHEGVRSRGRSSLLCWISIRVPALRKSTSQRCIPLKMVSNAELLTTTAKHTVELPVIGDAMPVQTMLGFGDRPYWASRGNVVSGQ